MCLEASPLPLRSRFRLSGLGFRLCVGVRLEECPPIQGLGLKVSGLGWFRVKGLEEA